jgi:hypothetical protein
MSIEDYWTAKRRAHTEAIMRICNPVAEEDARFA